MENFELMENSRPVAQRFAREMTQEEISAGRSQESSATRDLNSRISFSRAAAGVIQSNVFRGRPFI
ncbi:hypothetical protein JWH11_01420, partial [Xanthomonas melonis]|nr:hypothetical protein [Xanthomonas melonis]MCD0256858.1 hypothetical protein [Xanthomonas melonis]MCD0265120.1 hypothetical protein [Xanthomonas melonis]